MCQRAPAPPAHLLLHSTVHVHHRHIFVTLTGGDASGWGAGHSSTPFLPPSVASPSLLMPLSDSPTGGMGSAPLHVPYELDRESGHFAHAHAHAYGPPVAVRPLGMGAKRRARSQEREEGTPRKIAERASPGPGVLLSMASNARQVSEHIPSDALSLPLGAGEDSAHPLHVPLCLIPGSPLITNECSSTLHSRLGLHLDGIEPITAAEGVRVTVTIRFDAEENDSLGFGVLFGSVAPPFLSGSRVKRRKARLVFEVPMQVRLWAGSTYKRACAWSTTRLIHVFFFFALGISASSRAKKMRSRFLRCFDGMARPCGLLRSFALLTQRRHGDSLAPLQLAS